MCLDLMVEYEKPTKGVEVIGYKVAIKTKEDKLMPVYGNQGNHVDEYLKRWKIAQGWKSRFSLSEKYDCGWHVFKLKESAVRFKQMLDYYDWGKHRGHNKGKTKVIKVACKEVLAKGHTNIGNPRHFYSEAFTCKTQKVLKVY